MSRAAPCTWGAQRSEYASWTWVGSSRCELNDDRVGEQRHEVLPRSSIWPGWGRSAWISARKTWSVPRSAWIDSDAATSTSCMRASAVVEREDQLAEHAVGAVDEGEPLLLGELDGLEARVARARRPRGADAPPASRTSPSPMSAERHVRERREVARAAERAELVHDRRDARVDERRVGRGGRGAHARDPAAEVASAARPSSRARLRSRPQVPRPRRGSG